ncbi:unnamed protein product, partial [Symbiodinium natans]
DGFARVRERISQHERSVFKCTKGTEYFHRHEEYFHRHEEMIWAPTGFLCHKLRKKKQLVDTIGSFLGK